jgi:hypothetical protein
MFDVLNAALFGYRSDYGPMSSIYSQLASIQMANYYRDYENSLRCAPMTTEALDLLCSGYIAAHDYSNALSEAGRSLAMLRAHGLIERDTYKDQMTTYRPTEAGRKVIDSRRRAGLAAIGVYEVPPER